MAEAQDKLVKIKLANKIGDIVKRQHLTQQQAAELLVMPQTKVSLLLRGQFRGIGVAEMLVCLACLGRDIYIVVKPARRGAAAGEIGGEIGVRLQLIFSRYLVSKLVGRVKWIQV